MSNKITGVVSFDAFEVAQAILDELKEIERLQASMNAIQLRVLAYRQLLAAHGFPSFPENQRNAPEGNDTEAAAQLAARKIMALLSDRERESLTVADQMVLVLAERVSPMTANEVHAELERRGIRIAGVNPIASVLTMLRRDTRVMRRHSPRGLVHSIRGTMDDDQDGGAA